GHHQNENIMASQFRFPRLYISDHTKHVLCFSVLLFLISFVKFVEGNTDGPLFGLRLKNLTVEMGKNATFTCYVKNIGGYKVGWVKADTKSILAIGEFRISHNERVTVSNERQQKHHLHITGVTLEDAGPYMCQLNTAPMKSQVGYLNVVVKPDITKVTGTEGIVEGGTARLTCEAIGYPTPEIYWVREKGQHIIIWDKSIGRRHTVDKVEGNVLELHKIKRSQMGTYFCVAKSGYPPAVNQRVEIEVHFRPVISVPNQKVYAKEGQDVALECIIESYPKGLHYWELESGETLSSNNMKYLRHEFTINEYSIRSRLTILDFTTDDQGVYKCICKNSMNHAGDRVEGVVYLHMEKEFEAKGLKSIQPLENDILTNAVDYPRGYGNERSSFGGSESTTYFDIEHESNGDNPNRNYQQNYAWQEKQTTAYTNDYEQLMGETQNISVEHVLPCRTEIATLQAQWHTYSNKVALCESNNAQVTYSELVRDCTAVSQKLKAELKTKHGPSRISFLVPRNRSFVQALFGIFHSGNVAVPLCSDHPSEMLRYYIQNSESDLVIASHQSVDVIHQALKGNGSKRGVVLIEDLLKDGTKEPQPMETCLDDDDALIIYTSGTTGPPKGVVLTHGNLKAQTEAMIQDSLLHVLPLHHVHGITNCLLTPLSVGASLTMLEKFNPQQVWRFLLQQEERKPNLFMAVPTIYSKLIQTRPRGSNPDEIQTILRSKIRLMVSGSAALPVPVLEKWKSLTGHTLLERYGMTEIGMALTNPLEEWKRIPGSVGRPFPGVSARIVDISSNQSDIVLSESDRRKFKVNHRDKEESSGELQIKGPNVFKEYFGNAEATAKEFTHDGWFKTGDTAFMDRSGVFRILGRTSVDIIKSGGYKISALDIERVLLGHPDIKDVAVIGIPDEEYGQVVTALVVLDDTHKNINLTEISDWMSTKLPKYSVPRIWKSLQTLPRNTMGKVNKKELMSSHLPTLEVENPDHDTVPTADLLDWSVSGISGISTTFEKQDGVSEMSSSRASSQQVEFQSLQPELTNNDDDEETSVLQDHLRTPTNSKKANHDLTNTTPPVKDPGLTPKNSTVVKLSNDNGGSSSKLDHMRSRLKQLELIQPNLSQPSGASKIPRRSLSFTSDSAKSQIVETTSTYSKSSNPMDETVVPQTPASNDKVKKLEELLRQEAQKFKNQDSQIQSLRQVNRDLKADLERNRTAFKEKEHILSTLKNQWSQTLQRWSHEKDLNVKTLQEKDLTINKLNEDLDIVRNQVSVFEKELDRALSVADRFKTKMEEEEGLKDKLLDELMHERENGAKRTQELHQKIKQLSGEKVVLEQDLLSQMTKVDDLDVILTREKETSTKLKRDFQAEKGQFQEQIEDLESRQETLEDQLKQNKALETSLHNFYQRQMESILSEKIDMLQTHVEDLERNMIDEREDLRSLRAARQEADCLREQLRLADKTSLTFGSSFKSSNSFRSLSALKTRSEDSSDSSSKDWSSRFDLIYLTSPAIHLLAQEE
ncbi:hypothetical protein TCAL_05174, partial [Tigriopus californicus]